MSGSEEVRSARWREGPAMEERGKKEGACSANRRLSDAWEDSMWDRLPVTLVTVLKPFLRSMSGIVKVSCPFTGNTHTQHFHF